MAELTRHGASVSSVLDLLGTNENDLTSALGFALVKSTALLAAIVQRVWPAATGADLEAATLALEVRGDVGRTDLQIALPSALLIIEAKRDWLLPTVGQLRAYAPRVRAHGAGALVTLSQASGALARAQVPPEVDGVSVAHLSWRDVLVDLDAVRRDRRGLERVWLDELTTYLKGVVRLRSVADSWTYCVVLNNERPGDGGERTFRQYVADDHVYFHPYGAGGGRQSLRTSWRSAGRARCTASTASSRPMSCPACSTAGQTSRLPGTRRVLTPSTTSARSCHRTSRFRAARPTEHHACGSCSINSRPHPRSLQRSPAARAWPRPAEARMSPSSSVVTYTDGACKGNPGRGGWVVWLRSGLHERERGSAARRNSRRSGKSASRGM